MGTRQANTQEGPAVQESAGDWVWIAILHQPWIVLAIEKFWLVFIFILHQLPESQSGEIFILCHSLYSMEAAANLKIDNKGSSCNVCILNIDFAESKKC